MFKTNYDKKVDDEARNKAECLKENYDRGKRTTERNTSHEETDRLMEEANRVIEEAKRKEASEKKEELSTIARYVGVLAERGVRETEQKTPKSDEKITPPYEEKNNPISEEIILDTRPTAGPRKKFQDAERRKPSKGLWGRICEGIRTTLTGVTDYDREIEGDKERARKEWFDSGMDKRFNEQIRDEMKAKTRIR
ncbi:hypothetical protein COU61_00690 [Candidatus Pacearchaeota archaeon CG10_big_fil_rev_8_21_14_0_10_35_13]|nr:MAG: hypothetical protein COU61_00690 [Candidatus Pacearchaeota archaeon CG10_big_fil_rev_8_21_14_0_10_35_13]